MEPEAKFLNQMLAFKANPRVARALQQARQAIVRRWEEAVRETLPKADELTTRQVRDTIPIVLDQMVETKAITPEQRAEAFNTPVRVSAVLANQRAQYFTDWMDSQVRATSYSFAGLFDSGSGY